MDCSVFTWNTFDRSSRNICYERGPLKSNRPLLEDHQRAAHRFVHATDRKPPLFWDQFVPSLLQSLTVGFCCYIVCVAVLAEVSWWIGREMKKVASLNTGGCYRKVRRVVGNDAREARIKEDTPPIYLVGSPLHVIYYLHHRLFHVTLASSL